ncbi:hypothetical protein BAC3_01748 [uncultured bacterium]|nr:hypothetical protein BAC3_01748 [uncultured bacterium]
MNDSNESIASLKKMFEEELQKAREDGRLITNPDEILALKLKNVNTQEDKRLGYLRVMYDDAKKEVIIQANQASLEYLIYVATALADPDRVDGSHFHIDAPSEPLWMICTSQ